METLRVVISSTALDLPEHRGEIMAACLGQEVIPKMMEHLPAQAAGAIKASLDLVDSAELYVGIFAWRYGYVPTGSDISITEMEYNRATGQGIDRLIFLSHEEHPVKYADVETGPGAEQLRRLRERLQQEQVVAYFRSPDNLRALVSEALASHLQKRALAQASSPQADESPGVAKPPGLPALADNPYRSLEAFQQQDAAWYFGRDTLINETLAQYYSYLDSGINRPRLLAILGPSGSGKSSFARAGLMARLEKSATRDDVLITMVPGEHPLRSLVAAVNKACNVNAAEPGNNQPESWPSPLCPLPKANPGKLVLLVDQFEEVWSQCRSKDERQQFIDQLLAAAAAPDGRVSVLLTLRSDFLQQTQLHPKLNDLIAAQCKILPAMSAESLRRAITEPARLAGHPIDEATVGKLIDETIGHDGVLPLLQFVLSGIWRGMASGIEPAKTLQQLGGVGGALAADAERLYQALEPAEQVIARNAFLAMVELGEGRSDTRRRVPLALLSSPAGATKLRAVLERFAAPDCRLLTLAGEGSAATAEVTHEALFSHWQRFSEWLDSGREEIRFKRRLEAAVADWNRERALPEGEPAGLLWRPPLLTLLEDYHADHASEMGSDELAFYEASGEALKRAAEARDQLEREQQQALLESQRNKTRMWTGISLALGFLALVMVGAAGFFGFAVKHSLDPGEAWYALQTRLGWVEPVMPEFTTIGPGEFTRGSNFGDADEQPPRPVTISQTFLIGVFEITQAEYIYYAAKEGKNWPNPQWGRGNQPVINVSWHEAREYASWLTHHLPAEYGNHALECGLPTEAEWEYAARAGETAPWFWGDDEDKADSYAWYRGNSKNETHTKEETQEALTANDFGLYNMAGNVYEWVEDCWHRSYEGAPDDGSPWLEENGGNCEYRVLRGGSWGSGPEYLRSAIRDRILPGSRFNFIGFRVVCRPH